MKKIKQTSIDWFFDRIKDKFENDADLFESLLFTYSIAKQKNKREINNAYKKGLRQNEKPNRV